MARQRRRLMPLAAILVLSLATSGCGLYGSFGSLFGSDKTPAAAEITGSLRPKAASAENARAPASELPPAADLDYAKTAVIDVLTQGGKDVSAPWENPKSGAHGTVTPISVAYQQQGLTCRDFLASHLARDRDPAWMQGEACRNGSGRWEVRTMRPWSRT